MWSALSDAKKCLTPSLTAVKNIFTSPEKFWIALGIIKIIFTTRKTGFFGWQMYTHATLPWSGQDSVSLDFNKTHNKFIELVNSKKFKITQFPEKGRKLELLINSFKWRYYIIFWSVKYAINSTQSKQNNFVECGVCDGTSTYFAINSSITEKNSSPKFYLYDSWEEMTDKYLIESEKEKGIAGDYSYLEVDKAKSNLKEFKDLTVFNKGFLPDSLEHSINPSELIWMHIDLNSSKPTLSALEYFHKKMPPGGIILFDDYAWNYYEETKKTVDIFFKTTKGINFSLPTGQAIYFKLGEI